MEASKNINASSLKANLKTGRKLGLNPNANPSANPNTNPNANHTNGTAPNNTPRSTAHIIVVDDDKAIADLVVSLLRPEGFDATAYTNSKEALVAFERDNFDLAILDIMMPEMDGLELCRHIRDISDIPIVFLSAKDEETDQVIGLTLGADDYITKPFKPRELVARVKAHLRRAKRGQTIPNPNVIEVRGIAVDMLAHETTLHDQPILLTPKEFAILALLMQRAGQPVHTSEIYENVWNESYDINAANTVMVHIRHLRTKLAEIDSSTEFIETVWGVGYRVPTGNASSGGASSRNAAREGASSESTAPNNTSHESASSA